MSKTMSNAIAEIISKSRLTISRTILDKDNSAELEEQMNVKSATVTLKKILQKLCFKTHVEEDKLTKYFYDGYVISVEDMETIKMEIRNLMEAQDEEDKP